MRKSVPLVAAAGLLIAAVVSWASPALAITGPVDIRVEHDLDGDTDGPRVLEVSGVTPAAGPEITIADETSNPSGWGGNVLVDIDPDASTITVEVEDQNCYDSVIVTITTDEVGSISVLSDALFEAGSAMTLTTSVAAGVVTLAWNSDLDDCPGFGEVGSQAVFSYGPAGPSASLSPAVVQAGDPVTVTGTECADSPVSIVVLPAGGGDPVVEATATGDASGGWSHAIDTTALPAGSYSVQASCALVEGQAFDYEVLSFEVSAAPVAPVEPTPAEPVAATPTFTG